MEVQTVILRLPSLNLIIYNINRPPTADLELEELFGLAATEMMLVAGDFNPHHPLLGSSYSSNAAGRQLYVYFENSEHVLLLNDVRSPMHIRRGRLDLAFPSSCLAPAPAWSFYPAFTSDHFGIVLEVTIRLAPPPHPHPPRFNMRQTHWDLFKETAWDLLRNTDLHLPLDEHAVNICNVILQASSPTLKDTETHGYTTPE